MFDWNNNGKHDLYDDLFTLGLIQHMIDESKEDKKPPVQNNGRGLYTHHVNDEDKTDTRSEAVKCLWVIFGLAIMIGGIVLTVCFIENKLLAILALLVTLIVSFIVTYRATTTKTLNIQQQPTGTLICLWAVFCL